MPTGLRFKRGTAENKLPWLLRQSGPQQQPVAAGRFYFRPLPALPTSLPMLQLSVLRDQTDLVLAGLAKKHYATAEADVAAILDLDQRRRAAPNQPRRRPRPKPTSWPARSAA